MRRLKGSILKSVQIGQLDWAKPLRVDQADILRAVQLMGAPMSHSLELSLNLRQPIVEQRGTSTFKNLVAFSRVTSTNNYALAEDTPIEPKHKKSGATTQTQVTSGKLCAS